MAGAFILRNIDRFYFSDLQISKREEEKYKEDEKNILPYKPLVHPSSLLYFLPPLVKEYYPIYDRLYHQKRGFHYCPEIEDDNGRKAIENKHPLQRFPLGAYPVAPAILYAPTKNPWDGRIYMRKTQFVLTKEDLSTYTVEAGQFKIRFSREFLQWLWQMNKDLKRVAVFTDHPGALPEKLFDY